MAKPFSTFSFIVSVSPSTLTFSIGIKVSAPFGINEPVKVFIASPW